MLLTLAGDFRFVLRTIGLVLLQLTALVFVTYLGVLFVPHFPVGLGIVGSIALLILITAWLWLRISDFLKWRNWHKHEPNGIRADEFIGTANSYYSAQYQVRFINTVRTRGLIIISADTEDIIYNFAKDIEARQMFQSHDEVYWNIVVKRFLSQAKRVWTNYRSRTNNERLNDYYGVAVLDEVLRLLEQIRATR